MLQKLKNTRLSKGTEKFNKNLSEFNKNFKISTKISKNSTKIYQILRKIQVFYLVLFNFFSKFVWGRPIEL